MLLLIPGTCHQTQPEAQAVSSPWPADVIPTPPLPLEFPVVLETRVGKGDTPHNCSGLTLPQGWPWATPGEIPPPAPCTLHTPQTHI